MIRLTRAQVREIDRQATEVYHIPGIVLMENAGLAVADAACGMLGKCTGKVLIVCGGGNNGGDGLAAARHLHNRGAEVSLLLTVDPSTYKGDALINWQIVAAMRVPWAAATPELMADSPAGLLIDAIFGTGLSTAPRVPFPALAKAIDRSGIPVLAVDLPSGLDCDTGIPPGACVRATRTITFVAEKIGFASPCAQQFLGQVCIGSIGCPVELIAKIAGRGQASC